MVVLLTHHQAQARTILERSVMLSMISLDSVSLSFEFIGLRRGVVFSACRLRFHFWSCLCLCAFPLRDCLDLMCIDLHTSFSAYRRRKKMQCRLVKVIRYVEFWPSFLSLCSLIRPLRLVTSWKINRVFTPSLNWNCTESWSHETLAISLSPRRLSPFFHEMASYSSELTLLARTHGWRCYKRMSALDGEQ